MVNEGIEKRMNLKIRKELRVNLSNSFKDERENDFDDRMILSFC